MGSRGCARCHKREKYTTETFKEAIALKNPNIVICSSYVNKNTKMKCLCKVCGHQWETYASNLSSGNGCPKCSGNLKLNTDDFVCQMKSINPNITILGEYISTHKNVLCKCKICGNEWMASPANLKRGSGCPRCFASKGEKAVKKFLEQNHIQFYEQYKFDDCKSKRRLRFDFYIPSLDCAIEYDGEQHFIAIPYGQDNEKAKERLKAIKARDKIKDDYCEEHKIKLIRIPYIQYDEIEKILQSIL